MLTSKQLMERTGISRATLNNYIALGILPRPRVGVGGPGAGRARRIGYFDDNAVARVLEVQHLKKEGMSMAEIAAKFAPYAIGPEGAADFPAPVPAPPEQPERRAEEAVPIPLRPEGPARVTAGSGLRVTIDDVPHAAYMVNNNFEVEWWNNQAAVEIFRRPQGLEGEIEARNVFRLLLGPEVLADVSAWEEALRFHVAVAKNRLSAEALAKIYPHIGTDNARLLESLYAEVEPVTTRQITETPVRLPDVAGRQSYNLFASHFREGILFACVPADEDSGSLLDLLSRREQVFRDLLRKRMPFLTHLAVLVADLQDSVKICAELPPEEYFQLINDIWGVMEPVFRNYYGTHGKHVGDGMVYYFFPQPDCNFVMNALQCAHEVRETMRQVSLEWQARKSWTTELQLNIGLNEGQEWFGTYHSATNLEFTVLGDTINHAGRISDLARDGSIWVTKGMLGTLAPDERARVRFGIRRRDSDGNEVYIPSIYSRVSGLIDLTNEKYDKFRDIATLAVAEVSDIFDAEMSARLQ